MKTYTPSQETTRIIKRFNEIRDSNTYKTSEIIRILNNEGFKTKRGCRISASNLAQILHYNGYSLNPKVLSNEVIISPSLLKKAVIDCIKTSIKQSAIDNSINRETLRNRLISRYPYIYKNLKTFRLKIMIMSDFSLKGSEVINGWEIDSRYTPIVRKYSLIDNGHGYAKISSHYYHRVIMNCPKGKEVDHINGNIKDNRKSNLRICTRSENSRNRKLKGYTSIKDMGPMIRYSSTIHPVSYFFNKQDAINKSRMDSISKYGEFSRYYEKKVHTK